MFRNVKDLIFIGVTNKKAKSGNTFNLISFANPLTYDKFEVFLPEEINPYNLGIKDGDKVVIGLDIVQQGFNLRTTLLSMNSAKA